MDFLRLHSLHESLHFDSGANMSSFSDLLEPIVSFNSECDGVISDLDDLSSGCDLCANRRSSEMFDVDHDSYRNPACGKLLLGECSQWASWDSPRLVCEGWAFYRSGIKKAT